MPPPRDLVSHLIQPGLLLASSSSTTAAATTSKGWAAGDNDKEDDTMVPPPSPPPSSSSSSCSLLQESVVLVYEVQLPRSITDDNGQEKHHRANGNGNVNVNGEGLIKGVLLTRPTTKDNAATHHHSSVTEGIHLKVDNDEKWWKVSMASLKGMAVSLWNDDEKKGTEKVHMAVTEEKKIHHDHNDDDELLVLHTTTLKGSDSGSSSKNVVVVAGAKPLPWYYNNKDNGDDTSTGGDTATVTSNQGEMLYYGGSLTDVFTKADNIWLFHGACTWTTSELLEEIQTGKWMFAAARMDDLAEGRVRRGDGTGTAAGDQGLWQQLMESGRLEEAAF